MTHLRHFKDGWPLCWSQDQTDAFIGSYDVVDVDCPGCRKHIDWVAQTLEDMRPDLGCPTEGCKGDARYGAPGRGHNANCRYPIDPALHVG